MGLVLTVDAELGECMYSVQDIHLYLFLTVIEIEYRERVSWW